ncbi:MAG: SDR family oxidoreductase [Candidatus Sericytochromatia bacterium]
MSKTLILGSTGNIGSKLGEILKSKGQKVSLATSKNNLGEEQVHLNLVTRQGLEKAFEGIDKAFLLSPPGYTNQDELMSPVIDLSKKYNLKKVVFMTAMGADADPESPMRKAELYLEKSGINYNIIRPNWFMQNFNTFWLQGILNAQKIFLPVGNAKGSFIDSRDIASVAAELLLNDKWNNQAFNLTGKDVLDHNEVASILSKATGKNITYEEISPEAMREGLLSAGIPSDYTEFLLVILNYFKLGYAQTVTDSVKEIIGKEPISFNQYAEDYKSFW